jgi:hypothetical protein
MAKSESKHLGLSSQLSS